MNDKTKTAAAAIAKLAAGVVVEVLDWSRDVNSPTLATATVERVNTDGSIDVEVSPKDIEPYKQTALTENTSGPFRPGQFRRLAEVAAADPAPTVETGK
jgi:hypothetical protein